MKIRILFIGGGYPSHFYRLAEHLSSYDKTIQIDWLSSKDIPDKVKKEATFPIENFYYIKRNFPSLFYKIPILSSICVVIDFNRSIDYYQLNGYDIVSIQFVGSLYVFSIKNLKKIGKKLVFSPWGSDVLRISSLEKVFLKILYKSADYVTLLTEDFGNNVINLFNIPKEKCVYLDYGSDPLDTIINNLDRVSKNDAKLQLGLSQDSITIACGTNSAMSQRHGTIIESLISIRDQLPKNIVLMILLGRSKDYDDSVLEILKSSGFNYLCFDRRLSEWEMFLWRRATDYLIHGQVSDSNSVSIQEAMLCDTVVINGQWLRYPHHEKYGMPYIVFNDFTDLSSVVLEAVNGEGDVVTITNELKTDMRKMAWSNMIKEWDHFFHRLYKDE